MRCRRLCERKPSGRQHVPEAIVAEYKEGGERREVLEMALLESLARHGLNRSAYKRVKGEFVTKCKIIKERMEQKESETVGKWMTEEAMKKSGLFSATAIKNIIKYCQKFPESLIRPWRYNESIPEYFVVVDDQSSWKKTDTTIEQEETELKAAQQTL
ncbi:unnamed protein product [Durusdinium trenchii]|uniref:Uncharacterized protein n=1 Tax=Durusdinium trenchii TaxID=1381693 RepID=A0ABP0PIG1_9DINO